MPETHFRIHVSVAGTFSVNATLRRADGKPLAAMLARRLKTPPSVCPGMYVQIGVNEWPLRIDDVIWYDHTETLVVFAREEITYHDQGPAEILDRRARAEAFFDAWIAGMESVGWKLLPEGAMNGSEDGFKEALPC